jgi:16S rRNA (guanine966-N2)-methyltransferase
VRSLKAAQQRLGATHAAGRATDALAWMARCAPGRFELVLLDPPFDAGLLAPASRCGRAAAAGRGRLLYLESGAALPEPPWQG